MITLPANNQSLTLVEDRQDTGRFHAHGYDIRVDHDRCLCGLLTAGDTKCEKNNLG